VLGCRQFGPGDGHSVTGLATAASTTREGVEQSRIAADDLARMSGSLQRLVGQFRYWPHALRWCGGGTAARQRGCDTGI
jgi:hypothetical protein